MSLPIVATGDLIHCFAPLLGVTLEGTITPTGEPISVDVYKLAEDAVIGVNGISIVYVEGDILALQNNITYEFAYPVNAHKMGSGTFTNQPPITLLAVDDTIIDVPIGSTVSFNILTNDTGDIDPTSVELYPLVG